MNSQHSLLITFRLSEKHENSNTISIILEVKGIKKLKDESKWDYMETWIKALNQDEENGIWHFCVSQDETGRKVHEIIDNILKKTSEEEVA